MRQRQRDELRRAQRLCRGPFRLRRIRGCGVRVSRALRRGADQERGGDQQRPCGDADDQHREAPVIGGDQPARRWRDRQRRHAHAGRHQCDREAAMLVDPGAGKRHHRRIEAAGGRSRSARRSRAGIATGSAPGSPSPGRGRAAARPPAPRCGCRSGRTARPTRTPQSPMQRKSSVAAAEMPARDQPIASEIGCRNTASDSIVPKPTQVISAPAPTTTQP